MTGIGRTESAVDKGVLPSWLVRSGWVVVVLGVLGGLAAPAFNIHTSPGPAVLVLIGGVALWASPVYLLASLVCIVRGRRMGVEAAKSELVLTAFFVVGLTVLVVLAVVTG